MSRHNPRGKGASRSNPRFSSQVPGWVWLFTGSMIGAFVMFLIYLKDVPSQAPQVLDKLQNNNTGTNNTDTNNAEAASEPEDDKPPKPRFVFYELLKESEVIVNQDESSTDADTNTDTDTDTSTDTPAPTPASTATTKPVEYILQAGSFKNADDADRLRAELILHNLNARVDKTDIGGQTWHRVIVGPFATRDLASRARGTLASMDMESIMRTTGASE